MALAPGTRLGSYEITSAIGAGGMGEVYRARDTKLHRDVALKTLPDRLAADPDRLARFRREAQVLASLNHPNIAVLYGVEEWQGHQALVMEFVPGRTLADTVTIDGAVAIDAAVHVAAQIADALEAAHEAGVVHRDLKPANIKLRDDDVVKVLDFGLARAIELAGSGSAGATSSSPTLMSPAVTQPGVVLGTAGYMSPEQARGRMADKRSDIWAFGVVLYEMLTGRQLFAGETVPEVLSAVIRDAPQLDALPANTPPALRHLVARCLERDPKLRLRDIGEARILLRTALDPGNPLNRAATREPDAAPARRWAGLGRRAVIAAGTLALAGMAAVTAWYVKPDATAVPVRRFALPAMMADSNDVSLSPDASRVAYFKDGHLYVHALQTGTTADLGAVPPATQAVFWSADSQTIGYGAESTIRTVPATGGVPFTVCKIPASGRLMFALWRGDGTILFGVWRDSVYQVASTGGTPVLRVAIDPKTEIDFHNMTVLPGNRLVLATHLRGEDALRADVVDGDRRTPLASDVNIGAVQFAAPNQLLFLRIRTNPGLWVVPFDGVPVDFSKAVLVEPGAQLFDVTADGTLMVGLAARVRRELVWVARSGAVTPLPGAPFEWIQPAVAVSADGRRAVLPTRTSLWIDEVVVRDLATGRDTRLPPPTPSSGVAIGALVSWTPSGRLLYGAGGIEASKIYDWPADGSANGRALVDGLTARMSPDGKELLFTREARARIRLMRAPVLANGSIGAAAPVFPDDSPSVQWFDLSHDGRLLAFTSTDPVTSQYNISIATYPDLRERRQVTSEGGTQPRFSRDGRELFYASGIRTPDRIMRGQVRVVSIKTAPLTIGPPTVLLDEGDTRSGSDRPLNLIGFDIGPDGRLLMTRAVPSAPGDEARLMILQNWPASIRK